MPIFNCPIALAIFIAPNVPKYVVTGNRLDIPITKESTFTLSFDFIKTQTKTMIGTN